MQRPTISGCTLQNIDPSLVRFYRSETSSEKDDTTGPNIYNLKCCSYCFNALSPKDIHVRLKPRMRLTVSVKKLLKKAERNWIKLSKKKQHVLKLYANSENYMIVTCCSCSKTRRIAGFSRTDVENKRKKITKKGDAVKTLNTSKINTNSCKEIITKTLENLQSSKPLTSQLSFIMKSQSKKKKQKIAHKSLQHLLSLEKKKNISSLSLKDFLSSMKS